MARVTTSQDSARGVAGAPASGGARTASAGAGGGASPAKSAAGATASSTAGMSADAAGASGHSDAGGAAMTGAMASTTDYGAKGRFSDAKMFSNVGPDGNYTIFRPDASLGKDGFKHPIVGWANGIGTSPEFYQDTLTFIASHGFVIIGTNDTTAEEPAVSAGMAWLVQQNAAEGPLKDHLDLTREALIGYSWGGGAAIDTSSRPNVKCTASVHGMPPRRSDAFEKMHAPLLLFTSTGDTFVSAEGFVTPNYMKSTGQTFYATLDDPKIGHLFGLDDTEAMKDVCEIAGGLGEGFGTCASMGPERAPLMAWLYLWVFEDENARKYFYGDDCILCKAPWGMPQRKMF